MPLTVVDVSGLDFSTSEVNREQIRQIGELARDVGCFGIKGHGISPRITMNTYSKAREFFSQPEAFKRSYYIDDSPNHRGYVPFDEKGQYADEIGRCYEAYDLALEVSVDDPECRVDRRLIGPNVWPDLSGFRESVYTYYERVAEVGVLIISALESYLGLSPRSITQHMTRPISQLRLIHYLYPESGADPDSVNMGAHTDYEILTLLHQQQTGLQVLSPEEQWLTIPEDPEVLVVLLGDMLEALSNGMFRSTPHRVINSKPERLSLSYFVALNYDTLVHSRPECVSRARPAQYESFIAGDHVERMLKRDFPYLRNSSTPDSISLNDEWGANPFENRLNRQPRKFDT